MMNEKLIKLIEEYLKFQPQDNDYEMYMSSYDYAKSELGHFLEWLNKNGYELK